MKISIVGAGNVGSLTAMRLAQDGFSEIMLIDVLKGFAQGKACDLEDAQYLLKMNYNIEGIDDIAKIKDSEIIVITAGLARKPGMTREELLSKNSDILKDICLNIKKLAPDSIVIVVTNPLDLMTYFALKVTDFNPSRVFGMGASLDSARFANLISRELNIPVTDIDASVIGSHGEGMLPLSRFTLVRGISLDEFADERRIEKLIQRTISRGLEIVTLLGSGSAFFAPSAAIVSLVRAVAKDEKRNIGVCAYLNGEYGLKDICIGVPCRLGRQGIERIIELKLSIEESEKFHRSAENIRDLIKQLPLS